MRPSQQDLHYFSIVITKHNRKIEPHTLTQTQVHEGYTVQITPTDDINTLAKKEVVLPLFLSALREIFANEKSFKMSNNGQITLFTPTNSHNIKQWFSSLRNFECDKFCEKNNIALVTGDSFYQGNSVEYNSIILLSSALIQEMHTALTQLTLTERQEKEFKGPSPRW